VLSCHAISPLPSPLSLLSLSCSNIIGIRGAEALASYLMEVHNLQSLKLTSNRICNDGAIAMAEVSGAMYCIVVYNTALILYVC
jgi:hypothetical protein